MAIDTPVPSHMRSGRGRENHYGMDIHYFSSIDAPPGPPSHGQGNHARDPGVRTPGAGWALCERMGNMTMPLPGGLPPHGPPANCDWGRDGQDTPARPSIIFSSTDAPPGPNPHVWGNRMRGSGGATPGAGWSVCACTGNRAASAGGPVAPRSPCRLRLGRGRTNHAGTPVHYFSSTDAPPPPVPSCPGQSSRGGPGVRAPGQRRPSL
ncbi:hypothetical protein Metli_1639 [Methanofollis liminatans DSM 4140]|uniref:Uncharacterized protein n=1 Tax=Methanofollis liminatans DSM 4140 TaxID=28892 RepID=J1L3C7_9EURY|nr:hypothetical protein Metli_1639 [Methanofollis liminatans DSM 4140]